MDKNTFAILVRESELTLYRVSKSILANESDCADAVQEAVLKAYSNLDSLKHEQYFKTWLVRILIRECYRIRKTSKRFAPYVDYSEINYSGQNEDYSELRTAIMGLKEDLRIVVVLYYINGFSSMEIARILKIPKGTVNSRMAKARKVLKQTMEDERMDGIWIG
jgi:RNA polymerase sigma factor, sigma-70 family